MTKPNETARGGRAFKEWWNLNGRRSDHQICGEECKTVNLLRDCWRAAQAAKPIDAATVERIARKVWQQVKFGQWGPDDIRHAITEALAQTEADDDE